MIIHAFGGALPAASPSKAADFADLEALHKHLETINQFQVPSLELYRDSLSGGFHHMLDAQAPGDFSKASTATCVLSLIATAQWQSQGWNAQSEELAVKLLLSRWSSAELKENNVFTTAFILEAAHALYPPGVKNPDAASRLDLGDRILQEELERGYATVAGYPASAYLTQLAVRVLQKRDKLVPQLCVRVESWAWSEIHRQLALLQAHSKSADPYQLAYGIILAGQLGSPRTTTPDQALTLQHALATLFATQLPDGSWPRSQPLFHYPGVGTAHCYEYEMLVQLLSAAPQLQDRLLPYLPNLSRAAYALSQNAFELGDDTLGWSSGHHPQFPGPESWSTASVFHFAHALARLLAEAIRRWLFDHMEVKYKPLREPSAGEHEFGANLLDSDLAETGSLKATLYNSFVAPIAAQVNRVKAGRSLPATTPMSAIFFGPPGTSKTDLTRIISEYLGWPLLTVDPSYFVRNGLDQAQAEASRLFRMLSLTEQVVVLLDEFDEMVRDRGSATDVLSRFLTTGMLPKLATISRERRIVFIVATNYINSFDLAISRQGRFDLILQVMPPKFDEKMKRWPDVHANLKRLNLLDDSHVKDPLGDLTYLEFSTVAPQLACAENIPDVRAVIEEAFGKCTLSSKIAGSDNAPTWRTASDEQKGRIRLPPIVPA